MNTLKVKSLDVFMELTGGQHVINCTMEEAFALLSMPSMHGVISKLVPCYEVPEMPCDKE